MKHEYKNKTHEQNFRKKFYRHFGTYLSHFHFHFNNETLLIL